MTTIEDLLSSSGLSRQHSAIAAG